MQLKKSFLQKNTDDINNEKILQHKLYKITNCTDALLNKADSPKKI